MPVLLAADIGGTKSNLWLFEQTGTTRRIRQEATLQSSDHADACGVLAAFLNGARVDAAVIAIAGPVLNDRVETTNLPWVVERTALARLLGTGRVELINDLTATAYGIDELPPTGLVALNEGMAGTGALAIIAAGTGLGESALAPVAAGRLPVPSEGGHADFAPGNDVEIELLRYLMRRHGHVSWERVVSGPGLHAIYDFLVDSGRGRAAEALAAQMKAGDPSAAIAHAALDGSDPTASQALDIFVRLYGAEAGNLALKLFATGGVYVAGGIAPKILPRLRSGGFMEAFLAKGRHADLLGAIPVKVVLEPRTALIGASRRAAMIFAS